jgi:hypothetical protein
MTLGSPRLQGNRCLGRSFRTMHDDGGAEYLEVVLRLQPAEALGGLEYGSGGPTQGHVGIALAIHVVADTPHRAEEISTVGGMLPGGRASERDSSRGRQGGPR